MCLTHETGKCAAEHSSPYLPAFGLARSAPASGGPVSPTAAADSILTFAAAQLQRYSVRPPPRVEAAYHSFVASVPPDMHAEIVDCTEKQAWTNYQLAAPMVARRRKIARAWIDTSVWEALEDLSDDPFLEGRLSELKEHVEDVVGRAVEFDHVRLARLCLL